MGDITRHFVQKINALSYILKASEVLNLDVHEVKIPWSAIIILLVYVYHVMNSFYHMSLVIYSLDCYLLVSSVSANLFQIYCVLIFSNVEKLCLTIWYSTMMKYVYVSVPVESYFVSFIHSFFPFFLPFRYSICL